MCLMSFRIKRVIILQFEEAEGRNLECISRLKCVGYRQLSCQLLRRGCTGMDSDIEITGISYSLLVKRLVNSGVNYAPFQPCSNIMLLQKFVINSKKSSTNDK
jgi:hypothetical protein